MTLLLAAIFALSLAAHGGRYVNRLLSICIMGVAFYGYQLLAGRELIDAAVMGLIIILGVYIGIVIGWGEGFAAITKRYFKEERDLFYADNASDYVFKKTGNHRLAGAVFLTVRSAMLYPMFIALAAYTGDYYGFLLSGLFVLTMGVVYYAAGRVVEEAGAVRLAEVVYFAIIGGALA